MNKRMFKNIINQAGIEIDLSDSDTLKPDTIKIFFRDGKYYVFKIDKNKEGFLIIETESENRAYKEILKFFGIKLNHHGKMVESHKNEIRR